MIESTPISLIACRACRVIFAIDLAARAGEPVRVTCPNGHEFEPVHRIAWSELGGWMVQVPLTEATGAQLGFRRRVNELVSTAARSSRPSGGLLCKLCGRTYSNGRGLRRHLLRYHAQDFQHKISAADSSRRVPAEPAA